MHKKYFTRLLALFLSLLVVCMVAGCNNAPAQQTDDNAVSNTGPVNPVSNGMLVLSTDASLKITYDVDGLVMEVAGIDDRGTFIAEDYTDYLGKDCATVVTELIQASAANNYLSESVKNIVIKQALGSGLPGVNFLENLSLAAQSAATAAGSAAKVVVITAAQLDANGYINFESAKALLLNNLGAESFDKYTGSDVLQDSAYLCTVVVGGTTSYHSIDANTGIITDLTADELLGPDEEYYGGEDSFFDPENNWAEEEYPDEATVTDPEL